MLGRSFCVISRQGATERRRCPIGLNVLIPREIDSRSATPVFEHVVTQTVVPETGNSLDNSEG